MKYMRVELILLARKANVLPLYQYSRKEGSFRAGSHAHGLPTKKEQMVLLTGLEPVRSREHGILSPRRLPILPQEHINARLSGPPVLGKTMNSTL